MNDDNNKSVFIPFIYVYEPLNLITHSTIGAFLLIRKRSSHWVWKAWAGNVMSSWLKRGELLSVEAQHWEKHVWLKISSRIKRHCRFLTRYTPKLKILLAKCEKKSSTGIGVTASSCSSAILPRTWLRTTPTQSSSLRSAFLVFSLPGILAPSEKCRKKTSIFFLSRFVLW